MTQRVVAGALVDRRGAVLIAQRPPGKWGAGRWEFPGGKVEPGEDEESAVRRELAEELGVAVHAARRLGEVEHDYGDRAVRLSLWLVLRHEGEAQGLDGQALRWIDARELFDVNLLEAALPLLPVLQHALGAGRTGPI